MVVRIQKCLGRGNQPCFRALICGGLLVYASHWDRRVATQMLDRITESSGIERKSIRFKQLTNLDQNDKFRACGKQQAG